MLPISALLPRMRRRREGVIVGKVDFIDPLYLCCSQRHCTPSAHALENVVV